MKTENDELEIGSEGAEMVSVVAVEPLEDYKLRIKLSDGRTGIFDVLPYLNKGVFRELKDQNYFRRVYVDCDTVVWPHEQDIAPETIEMLLQPEQSPNKKSKRKTGSTILSNDIK
jgi:hypothetical protein